MKTTMDCDNKLEPFPVQVAVCVPLPVAVLYSDSAASPPLESELNSDGEYPDPATNASLLGLSWKKAKTASPIKGVLVLVLTLAVALLDTVPVARIGEVVTHPEISHK